MLLSSATPEMKLKFIAEKSLPLSIDMRAFWNQLRLAHAAISHMPAWPLYDIFLVLAQLELMQLRQPVLQSYRCQRRWAASASVQRRMRRLVQPHVPVIFWQTSRPCHWTSLHPMKAWLR